MNGWEADMADNAKGNTRMAKVYGHFTEIGSVYSHDIVAVQSPVNPYMWNSVEHTPAQLKLQTTRHNGVPVIFLYISNKTLYYKNMKELKSITKKD